MEKLYFTCDKNCLLLKLLWPHDGWGAVRKFLEFKKYLDWLKTYFLAWFNVFINLRFKFSVESQNQRNRLVGQVAQQS